MIINKAYKVELRPNNKQRSLLARSAGCARFAYNWGLAQRIELYKKEKKSTNAVEQHKELCKLKKSDYPCRRLGFHRISGTEDWVLRWKSSDGPRNCLTSTGCRGIFKVGGIMLCFL